MTRIILGKKFLKPYSNLSLVSYSITLEQLINRANMSCTVQDIIDGKIPDEYLKKRIFFYHFIFRHIETNEFLYPSLIDHFTKERGGSVRFFEPTKPIRKSDNKVILKRAEDFGRQEINPKQMRAINFNVAAENGDLIQPIFTTINTYKKPEVYDIPEDVMAYFIHKSDYELLKKFLDMITL